MLCSTKYFAQSGQKVQLKRIFSNEIAAALKGECITLNAQLSTSLAITLGSALPIWTFGI
jgi:hypothetical protein